MASIHRLLYTHCTSDTSELKASGYSVRKSSLPDAERDQLDKVRRAVEPLLDYELPKDATAAHKKILSADTAPRRLIFFPNYQGSQVAGQVSYRTFDTSQPPRPGNYFADVITARSLDPRSRDLEPAWSPCDVLQLWAVGHDRKTVAGSDWWISSEDELAAAESDGPWKPLAPTSVAAVREPRPPLIDDAAAHRFLSSGGVAADPLVPARWWAMPAERRLELVAHMLQATIQGPARGGRETVTIAAEPSVAAVLFYIVCRLLPRRIAAGVSFSTYEPAPERPLTGLVATTFLDEEAPTADLPPELAQRGFACNTFRDVSKYGRCQPPPERGYARRLVALAAANDWAGIDSLLAALDAEGLKAADLDQLIKIDHLVTAYFNDEKPPGLGGRRGPQEARFLRERFRSVLETQAASRADWPSDLVEVAIICLEGDLENLWSGSEAVHALLARHLPVGGEGLGRLLEPPQGRPSPPPSLVAAAVVSATLRGKPPHLPSRFLKHCREAREGRNRAAAVDLLGAVIRGLPADRRSDFLIGADSASVTDLLIDVIRTLSPPEQDGLKHALTESLSNAIKKLTAKDLAAAAELLHRQADAASWTAASHPGLRAHLDAFFEAVLDDAAREPGRCLVDASGRSRVARLQQWTDHTRDRERIRARLSHWKKLHDAVTRLAADAPAWRSWAKPAIPEGSAVPAAVAAIDGLRPFDVQHRTTAPTRQQQLAEIVVQTFKQALPEGSDQHAGWKTVGHWLERAVAEEADRKAPGAAGAGSGLSTIAISGIAAGIAAVIAALGLWGYSQGALDSLLPEGERQVAAAPQDPGKATPPDGGKTPRPGDPSSPNAPAASVPPTPREPPELPPPTPLSAADLKLQLGEDKGSLSVKWAHGELKDLIKTAKLTWKGPDHAKHQPLAATDGSATIDTKGCGFGKYEVTLSVTPIDGTGQPVLAQAEIPIEPPPQIQFRDPAIEIQGGKPVLKVRVSSAADKRFSYRLRGPDDFSRLAHASADGTLRFDLLDSVTPTNYQTLLSQLRVATVAPQGTTEPVSLPPIQPPDTRNQLLASLEQKQHITPLADVPGKEAQRLCDLPWSLGPDQFDLWLMKPEFVPGLSLTLEPKDAGGKKLRWPCNATVTGDAQELKKFLVGHFEVENISPWQPRLQFKPAANKEIGHDDAYAALRCCRLCLVIAGQPVATCQLRPVQTLGRLLVTLPEDENERCLSGVVLPRLLNQPRLDFGPKQSEGGELTLHIEAQGANQMAIVKAEGNPVTKATVSFNNGVFTATKSIWASETRLGKAYESKGRRSKEKESEDKTKKLKDYKDELEKLEEEKKRLEGKPVKERSPTDQQRLAGLNSKLIPDVERRITKQQRLVDSLSEDLARIADVEKVNAARFLLDEWLISADTTFADGRKPAPEGDAALRSRVVLVRGSPKTPPVEFVAPPPARSPDLPDSDAP